MARKKRQFSFIRLLLVILIIIALGVIIFFGVKIVLNKTNSATVNDKKTDAENVVSSTNEEVKIEQGEYIVYLDDKDELGFNFIVATLKFTTTNDSLYYDLNNLTNSEREIKLGDVDGYISKLESLGYDVSKVNLSSEIQSDTNSLEANILIPFVNKTGVLNVYNGEKIEFDLSHNKTNASVLLPTTHADQTIIESDDYNIVVSNSFISTMMEHNGQEYDASGIDVYTFKLDIRKVESGVKIEKAIFIKEGTVVENEALDSSYESVKVPNIINKELTVGMDGALFFELYKNNGESFNGNGVLRIKFSNSNDWIEISTVIK